MDRKKINIKAILLIGVALMMLFGFMPGGTLAVTENPTGGVFIRDEGSEYFYMTQQSQNQNVKAELAWRYGDYVYFALSCQKSVSVDQDEFKINGVTVGDTNNWLLAEGVDITLHDGPDSVTSPIVFPAGDGGQPRIWLVGRIHLSDTSLAVTFENISHAHGWEIEGVSNFDADLTVSHKYGNDDAILDFDQSKPSISAGDSISTHPVPKDGYEYTSVTVKIGDTTVTDLDAQGITKDGSGNLSFTVTDEMAANGVSIEYVYTAVYPLTIHYVYEGGSKAADDHTETLAEGASYSVTSPTISGYTPSQAVVSGTMPGEAVEVTVVYTINKHTLTINYIYEDGTTAAPTVSKTVPYNTQYSETSPTITGYTPDKAVVAGTMPDADVTVTVIYKANEYPLTVHYVYAQGGTAAPDHTETVKYGAEYSVTSPTVTGYTPDPAKVSGTMPAQAVEETVIYTKTNYTLTVEYVFKDGTTAAPTYTQQVPYSEQYSVNSPEVTGYSPDRTVVTGTMPAEDHKETVVYTANDYQLTVHYVYENGGGTAAPDHTETIKYGAEY
ncbi:MAG: MucBP domain-containing protein, partial [Eubacteriaceae bacterium]|nr:MucBP domain-containing protein [Eubacteriaceae bacterium]